jgi:hypothetical protein
VKVLVFVTEYSTELHRELLKRHVDGVEFIVEPRVITRGSVRFIQYDVYEVKDSNDYWDGVPGSEEDLIRKGL